MSRPRVTGAITVGLALPAAAWLVLTEAHPAGWVLVATAVAVGPVAAAVGAASRADVPPGGRRLWHTAGAAAIALAAAAAASTGVLAAALAGGASAGQALVDAGRGLLVALALTTPSAAALLAFAPLAGRPERPDQRPQRGRRGTTRRRFLQAGAGGAAAATATYHSLGVGPARAAPEATKLKITEGDLTMVDGSPAFFRGFTTPDRDEPLLPGPPLGNPGPLPTAPEITEGETVRVAITNDTPRDHTFLIESTTSEAPVRPVVGPVTIPAHRSTPVLIEFTAPAAGTYIYRDADRNNRLLGMHGVMVVLPRGARGENRPYAPAPGRLEIPAEVVLQFVWACHAYDPVLGELARQQFRTSHVAYPLADLLPRYFFLNGRNGVDALHDTGTVPVLPLQDALGPQVGCLIRCVNTGIAVHSLHWHGNHVFVLQRNAVPAAAGLVFEKDVLRLAPLHRVDTLLPAHTGLDSWPMLTPDHPKFDHQVYPMHCHAEMSQTAGGGLYPMGMLADWHLAGGDARSVRNVQERIADEREAIRRNGSAVVALPGGETRPSRALRRLRLSVRAVPAPPHASRPTRFRFRTTAVIKGRRRAVRARVRFAGRTLSTGRDGRAGVKLLFRRPGVRRARAIRRGYRSATRLIRIRGRR